MLINNEIAVNADYTRVIPRDLFNEAKLLKCLGQLSLYIHDEDTPVAMTITVINEDIAGFEVGLSDDGMLVATNLAITVNGKEVTMGTTYNSKEAYPLIAFHDYCEYRVFNEQGKWHNDFIAFTEAL